MDATNSGRAPNSHVLSWAANRLDRLANDLAYMSWWPSPPPEGFTVLVDAIDDAGTACATLDVDRAWAALEDAATAAHRCDVGLGRDLGRVTETILALAEESDAAIGERAVAA